MLVSSLNFLIFFIITLIVYYLLIKKSKRLQNICLLIASYIYYGIVNWKMIPLLLFSTLIFYYLGIIISKQNKVNEKKASRYTTLGVLIGLLVLLYFKYLNFFIESFSDFLCAIGLQTNISTFNIIMPLGVSFFTFKLISYIIEIHRENIKPCEDLISFSTYISFFPTIMSGPIDRPNKFLPQLETNRQFNYYNVSEGCKRILWGLFEKMCIADRLSSYTDAVFNNYSHHNTTTLIVASIFYAFQLYTDFAGYSDMAIGVGRILGIRIQENFRRPYFSQDISEYWKRWHITLTTWLVDYLFTPLNIKFRNFKGQLGINLAILINLIAIGMWHGANWIFALYGLYHGILLVCINLTNKRRRKIEKKYRLKNNNLYKYTRIFFTFILVVIGDIAFRSGSTDAFFGYLYQMTLGFGSLFTESSLSVFTFGTLSIIMMIFKEYKDENGYNIHFLHSSNLYVKIVSFALLLSYTIYTGQLFGGQFIYFQF